MKESHRDCLTFANGRVAVVTGDITLMEVDAVVNAANSTLLGGGGVDGAIHKAGGPDVLAECREIRNSSHPDGLPTGEAVITTSGRMPCAKVIHTVGPVWHGGSSGEDGLLGNAYRSSLDLARDNGLKSIAFPALSTGVYGFPRDRAARIVHTTLREYAAANTLPELIYLVFFSPADAEVFTRSIPCP